MVGPFFASDNTCPICQAGYQSSCLHREPIGAIGAQAESLRVPLADGTLVATPELPPEDLVPSLLAASDVLGTGWFGAVAAEVGPGRTVATDLVTELGDEGVARIKELTGRLGAHSVIEAVGTQESMLQAIRSTRPGGTSATSASPTGSSCPAGSCSSPTCTCTAARPRCAASCPS